MDLMHSWETLIKCMEIHTFAVYVHLNALIQKAIATLFQMGSGIRMWVRNVPAVGQKHLNISEFMFLHPFLCFYVLLARMGFRVSLLLLALAVVVVFGQKKRPASKEWNYRDGCELLSVIKNDKYVGQKTPKH